MSMRVIFCITSKLCECGVQEVVEVPSEEQQDLSVHDVNITVCNIHQLKLSSTKLKEYNIWI